MALGTRARFLVPTLITTVLAIVPSGCGGGDDDEDAAKPGVPSSAELRRELAQATSSSVADFPATRGRTLQQVADRLDGGGPEVGLATSVLTPGSNRLAFGVIDPRTGFVYGKTAVYWAPSPNARAQGPFPAPADLLITDPAFRSRTAATEKDPFAAVYSTTLDFTRPGPVSILVVTKAGGKLIGAPTELRVITARRDTVPAVGDRAPVVATETVQSAGGDIASIDTRIPPDDMHRVNFKDVVGKKPVVLLFATPQLCQSRVCGPVVDIAAQLEQKYGDRVEFIHQEVYVDNDIDKGLRPPLRRYGLRTEPWLFVVDANGRVAARLEGSFGFNTVDQAINKAI